MVFVYILQVGSTEEAKKAIDVGVDAIIVQGREAGGHVIGQVQVQVLLVYPSLFS